jgi:hypothetical protein
VLAVFLYKVLTVSGYQFRSHPLFKNTEKTIKEDLRKEESRRVREKQRRDFNTLPYTLSNKLLLQHTSFL